MQIKAQRPVCLGRIIGGERAEACIGCPLQTQAVNVTDEFAQSGVVPVVSPDLLQELQKAYDILQDPTRRQHALAQQILKDISDTAIRHLMLARQSVTDCPQYRRTPPSTP